MGAWWRVKYGMLATRPHGQTRETRRKRLVTAPLPGRALVFLDGSEQSRSGTQPHDQIRADLLPVSPRNGLGRAAGAPKAYRKTTTYYYGNEHGDHARSTLEISTLGLASPLGSLRALEQRVVMRETAVLAPN